MQPLCVACLCKGRPAKPLTEPALVKYYQDIVKDVQKPLPDSVISPRLCRACGTRLKRALLFTKRVRESYLMLQTSLLKLDTKEFAILAKQLNYTLCSVEEQMDIPSDNGLVPNDMDEVELAPNETGIDEGPASVITRIEGHAPVYIVPVKYEIQEVEEAVPVSDEIQEDEEAVPVNDEIKCEAVPVSDEIQEDEEAVPVNDEIKYKEEAVRVSDEIKYKEEAVRVSDEIKYKEEAVQVSDEIKYKEEAVQVSDEIKYKEEAVRVSDEIKYKEEAVHVSDEIEYKEEAVLFSEEEVSVHNEIKVEVTFEGVNEDVPEEVDVVKQEVLEEHHDMDEETLSNESNIFQDIAMTSMSVKKMEPSEETETKAEYSCDGCHEAFTSRNGLKQHIVDFDIYPHFGNQYEKKPCKQINRSMNEPTSQRLPSSGYRPLIYRAIRSGPSVEASDKKTVHHCLLCQKGFVSSSELDIHLSSHASKKSSECPVCSKMFKSIYALGGHMKLHAGEKTSKCSVCQRTFATKKLLIEHLWTHSKDRPFKCTTCQREFATSSLLAAHVKTHTEDGYQCKICHKTLSTRCYLIKHTRFKHSNDYKPDPHRCDICHKEFSSNDSLREHMTTHTGVKPYDCSVCQKRYSSSGHLRKHVRKHMQFGPTTSID